MTRRTIILSWILSFFLVANSLGQVGIRKGFKIGYNISKMTGNHLKNVRELKSLTDGVSLELNLISLFWIQGDLLYSPRGANFTIDGKNIETKLNYFSVPIFIKYKIFPIGFHLYLFAGLEFGSIISAKQGGNDIKSNINSSETSFFIGGGIEFSLVGSSAYV